MSNNKKYVSLPRLSDFLDNLKNIFLSKTDYKVDDALSSTSTNPVQNKVVDAEFESISQAMLALDTAIDGKADTSHTHTIANVTNLQTTLDAKVPTSRTVNGKALTSNITLSASDVGLGNVDNTADSAKSVKYATSAGSATKATQDASGNTITSTYETKADASAKLTSANEYTDTAISNLINSAPTTLDTLGEIATAMEENEDVVEALETAIGTKANASDLTSHTSNKSNPHGVTLSQLGVTATATELNKMDGVTATATEINKLDGLTATTDELNKLDGVTATTTELNYVDGVTSNIQTQLDSKQATITGGATTITSNNLTANRALASNSSGKIIVSEVTSTELGYLDGVTSNIQTQLDEKAASSHTHSDLESDISDLDTRVSKKVSKSGDTMTGQLTIQRSDNVSPVFALKTPLNSSSQTATLYISKNGNSSTDGGSTITDETFDGDSISIEIKRNESSLKNRVRIKDITDGSITRYALYGEHNKPSCSDIGAAASSHTHSATDITSGTLSAYVLPKASTTLAGIVTIGDQDFAGTKTFEEKVFAAGIGLNGSISADTANAYDIGTAQNPFKNIHTQNLYANSKVVAGSILRGGGFITNTEGTADTKGKITLEVGNYIQKGNAGNMQGYIEVYNENDGSTILSTSHTSGSTYYLNFPSHGGTLVTESDLETMASISTLTTAEYTALEEAGTTNANTLYMLTDAEEDTVAVPAPTADDEGKFLRVVDGVPTWVTIPNAEGVSF